MRGRFATGVAARRLRVSNASKRVEFAGGFLVIGSAGWQRVASAPLHLDQGAAGVTVGQAVPVRRVDDPAVPHRGACVAGQHC